ncbi:glycogen synthase [candidate division WWE3 bacterium]|nr:glycogen synthase [candidate division WWE3 bacterium]
MAPAVNLSILDKVEDFLVPKSLLNSRSHNIVMVTPEASPYASVGGLSRVISALSTALIKLGHDVRIFMPKFGSIDEREFELEMVYEGLKVPTGNSDKPYLICNVKRHKIPGRAPVYFLENREYYELRANVYGYNDDAVRWGLLSRGVLEYLLCCSDWIPDIIHANDWQTGYIPNYLETALKESPLYEKTATVFTIHNLSYQGMFDHRNVSDFDFDDGKSDIADFFNPRLMKQNFMRRGIMYSDVVNTVSPTYSRQIMKPEYGEGLDRLLSESRSKLSGILNAIDYAEYDPTSDKLLTATFNVQTLERRKFNKAALQKEFDLKQDLSIPLISYVGRLDGYKGLHLLLEIIPPLLRDFSVQFVFVGGGDSGIASRIRAIQEKYPDMVGAHLMLDFDLPRLVFGGSDLVAMPSAFEPCGLVQMEAMRYGAIPIVHSTGGLADSVQDYNPATEEGFGFVFRNFDGWSLFAQIIRAIETYRSKDIWTNLQKNAMSLDNSWEARGVEYISLYDKAIQLHNRKLSHQGKNFLQRDILE